VHENLLNPLFDDRQGPAFENAGDVRGGVVAVILEAGKDSGKDNVLVEIVDIVGRD
jgi:hypothetical protein